MGELKQLRGNEWQYTIRDWRGGVTAYGPQNLERIGAPNEVDTFYEVQNFDSLSGRLEPVMGDAVYNSVSFTGTGAEIGNVDFMFPYIRQDNNGLLLLVGSGGQLFEHPTSGSSTTITGLVTLTGAGVDRFGAQALGYCYIGGSSLTLLRYCHKNPGGQGKLSFAGTAAPTNAPTMALRGSGDLTSSTGYTYRYAWEYGVTATSGRGELGMGWKQATTLATATAVSTSISITMDASPPASFSHVVARSLWRNDTDDARFFLVTRTAYTGSALPTSILDTTAAVSISLGEEIDPPYAQTITAPLYSELLPPKMQFVAVHEGRLWGLDITTADGTRYPHRVVYSRIAGFAPHFDQFDLTSTIQAADGNVGLPTGLVAWMGNLYALFERGISMLASDPGPGRVPAFSQIVYGRGCTKPKTVAVTNDGVAMLSSEGMMLFNGSASPARFSEKIWNLMRAYLNTPVGGYEPLYRQYTLSTSTGYTFSYNFDSGRWVQGLDTLTIWNYSCQAGNDLVYGSVSGSNNSAAKVYKRKRGTLGGKLDGTAANRFVVQHVTDLGMNGIKHMHDWILEFRTLVTPTAATDSVNFSFFTNDPVSQVNFKLPATPGTMFRGVFNPAQSAWDKFNWSLQLPAGDSPTSISMIDSMTLRFTVEPDRNMVTNV